MRYVQAPQRGFTLIELVIVLILVGVLGVLTVGLLVGNVGGYLDQQRRAELVDQSDRALRRMVRETRHALPNSLRVNTCDGAPCVEFLATEAGGRYRAGPGPAPVGGAPERRLRTNVTEYSFNAQGGLGVGNGSYDWFVSVYNTGQPGANAWDQTEPGSMTLTRGVTLAADPDVPEETRITLAQPFRFALESPRQRFFLVSGPVAFVCEGGQLLRYAGYEPGQTHSAGTGNPLSGDVEDCRFSYQAGTSSRAALLSLELVLARDGERVRLLHQVHVDNAP